MALYSRLDFTYASKLVVRLCRVPTADKVPGGDITFIRLKVTENSMSFIRLSIKLHRGEI